MDTKTILFNIKRIRELKGLCQVDITEELGISTNTKLGHVVSSVPTSIHSSQTQNTQCGTNRICLNSFAKETRQRTGKN